MRDMNKLIRQFTSYLMVGGGAALVEWSAFALLYLGLDAHYILATFVAFILATFANFLLGKRLTFRKAQSGLNSSQEMAAVYLISAVGLALNMLLMYLQVARLGWPGMPAKIMATGIVLVWNFLMRKIYLYKI